MYIHSRCSELRLSKQTMSKVQYTIDHHTNSFFFFCTPFFLFFHPNPRLFFILYSFFLLFQSSFCQGMNRCLFKLAKEKKKKRGTKNRKSERQRISASRNGWLVKCSVILVCLLLLSLKAIIYTLDDMISLLFFL